MIPADYHDDKPNPLPIDWEIPTYRCKLAIRGTGHEIGYLNIKDARIRDFLQPAIFPEDIEIWPPGSRSEIAWLHYVSAKFLETCLPHPEALRPLLPTLGLWTTTERALPCREFYPCRNTNTT
jgi:hypothetical protein